MGGIFAVLSPTQRNVVEYIIGGLKRLEYRGFNGSGIAILSGNEVVVYKDAQLIDVVADKYGLKSLSSWIALGHTRYATHGKPHADNTQPHTDCSNSVAVAEDGAVANYEVLKDSLIVEGHRIVSRCDAELIAHLIEKYYTITSDFESAFRKAVAGLDGYFSLAVMDSHCRCLLAYTHGPPLYIGTSKDFIAISSGKSALLNLADKYFRLEYGEIALVSTSGVRVEALDGARIEKEVSPIDVDPRYVDKDGYPHHMLREIYEVPEALMRTLYTVQEKYLNFAARLVIDAERIFMVANGSSLHAAYIGSYYLTELTGVTPIVVSAAEFPLYHVDSVGPGTVVIAISQSGETSDVITSVFEAKLRGATILGITNYIGSRIANLSNLYLPIGAGPELAIPATKTFTSTLLLLYLVSLKAALQAKRIDGEEFKKRMGEVKNLSAILSNNLKRIEMQAEEAARGMVQCRSGYVVSRGLTYPLALEGALKLKEAAYVHAEGVEAGEFRHGPQTLLEKGVFTTFILPVEKQALQATYSLISMALEKSTTTIAVGFEVEQKLSELNGSLLKVLVPYVDRHLAPIILSIPLQFIAYKLGVLLQRPIDSPRYLSKTVH
jgi:glucosamine--fructose-6-phosphate aminotransferase (isomerizing)